MVDSFYASFENRFRGTRAAVKKRLEVYVPLLAEVKQLGQPCTLLDLGCGRGEWLEMAQEAGWNAFGVDLDEGMLADAFSLGLPARQADLFVHLEEQAEASLGVVTAFHVAEHLPFSDLLRLLRQSHRVLRPGGIMILETPNPENLVVAGNTFHLDPSHRNPLPPELLSFLAEDSGFFRTAVIRLHAPPDFTPAAISMQGLLYGVSPDYALVAQKAARGPLSAGCAWPPVLEEQGRSLFEAAAAYDYSLHRHLDGIRNQQENQAARGREALELHAWHQEEKNAGLREALGLQTRLWEEQLVQLERRQQELLQGLAARLEQELQRIYASESGRPTSPLRRFFSLLRRSKERVLRVSSCLVGAISGFGQLPGHSQALSVTPAETEAVVPVEPEAAPPPAVSAIIEDGESVPADGGAPGENALAGYGELFVSRETRLYENLKVAADRTEP